MATIDNDACVLVTGVSGYIASHAAQQLQQAGWKVRGTVRSLSNKDKIEPLNNLCPEAKHPLDLVEIDLLDPVEQWTDVVRGCQYVLHIASPFLADDPEDENDVIKPAVDGTLAVLNACTRVGGVKKVVLTSSIAAISGGITGGTYTEDDWMDLSNPKHLVYIRSKTLQEKAAWKYQEEHADDPNAFALVVINPGFVIGPPLCGSMSPTMLLGANLLNDTLSALPQVNYPLVDVRDVALAHVRAIEKPEADGKRFIINGDNLWFSEIAAAVSEEFTPQGYNVPTKTMYNGILWIASFFNKKAARIYPMVSKPTYFNIDRMKNILEIQPRGIKASMIEMCYSMIEKGMIHKTEQYTPKL